MATILGLYNHALVLMGERTLTTDETREARSVIDTVYSDVVNGCLEAGMWNFALRIASVATTGAGSLGFSYAFTKPTDFVHLFGASVDTTFNTRLKTDFADFGGAFHANSTPLYLAYTSNSNSYGLNLTAWPQLFTLYVSAAIAARTALRITGSPVIAERLEETENVSLVRALSIHSVTTFPGLLPFESDARGGIVQKPDLAPAQAAPFDRHLRMAMPQPQKQGGNSGQ
jgi:hypothetical protein